MNVEMPVPLPAFADRALHLPGLSVIADIESGKSVSADVAIPFGSKLVGIGIKRLDILLVHRPDGEHEQMEQDFFAKPFDNGQQAVGSEHVSSRCRQLMRQALSCLPLYVKKRARRVSVWSCRHPRTIAPNAGKPLFLPGKTGTGARCSGGR